MEVCISHKIRALRTIWSHNWLIFSANFCLTKRIMNVLDFLSTIHGATKGFTKLQKTSWEFIRLRKTSWDFTRLHVTSDFIWDFKRLWKISKNFIKLQERSLCCFPLGNNQNEYIIISLQARRITCCSVGKCQRM